MKRKKILSILLILSILTALLAVLGVTAFAATATMPEADRGEVVDVWLIAGQSNAVGYGENYPTTEAYSSDRALLSAGIS